MDGMGTNRLEAFSDGVIAVIITIMVLELKPPHDTTLTSLRSLAPEFLSYILSFLVVAIMWVNHHHMMHSVRRADARLLWACLLYTSQSMTTIFRRTRQTTCGCRRLAVAGGLC